MSDENTQSKIYTAFIKAQKEFGAALKTSTNPHFKSKYADLASCIDAVVGALNNNGIGFTQYVHESEKGVCVETIFLHESGEIMTSGQLTVPVVKNDAQGYGSALTYARRYSVMAACGIAPEDDDGNAATKAAPALLKPTANKSVAQDSFDKLPLADQESLRTVAIEAIYLFEQKDLGGANEYIELQNFEPTMLTAFWHLIPSNHRAALKKYREEKRNGISE